MDIVPILNAQYGGLVMEKIKMTTPLVEMDGDEMTRVLWKLIKFLILPIFMIITIYYYIINFIPFFINKYHMLSSKFIANSPNNTFYIYNISVFCVFVKQTFFTFISA